MCELALFDPAESSIVRQVKYLRGMYEYNTDGLGVVAIYRNDDELKYAYYKSETPRWNNVTNFLHDNNDAWRIAGHARLATAGGTGLEQTHPIEVVDDSVDFDLVMHNGVVSGARRIRKSLQSAGHKFKTTVDSEVIPIKHAVLPDDIEELEHPTGMYGSLNYFLFSNDGILVRAESKYDLDEENFKMGLSSRDEGICNTITDTRDGRDGTWMIVGPDEIQNKKTDGFGTVIRTRSKNASSGSGNGDGSETDSSSRWDEAYRNGYKGKEEYGQGENWAERRFGDGGTTADSDWDSHQPCECGMASAGTCPECDDFNADVDASDSEKTVEEHIADQYEHGLEYFFGRYNHGE